MAVRLQRSRQMEHPSFTHQPQLVVLHSHRGHPLSGLSGTLGHRQHKKLRRYYRVLGILQLPADLPFLCGGHTGLLPQLQSHTIPQSSRVFSIIARLRYYAEIAFEIASSCHLALTPYLFAKLHRITQNKQTSSNNETTQWHTWYLFTTQPSPHLSF